MVNQTVIAHETIYPSLELKEAINSLMANPLLQASFIDDYGNEWVTFQFKVSNQNASSGSEVIISDLDIVYDWETTLSASENLDRELNQGIALGTGNQVSVPLSVSSTVTLQATLSPGTTFVGSRTMLSPVPREDELFLIHS